jgi:phage I-like protein
MKAVLILKSIDGAPDMFQVLPFGQIDIEGEPPAFLDDEGMNSIIANFERRGNKMVVDYEHQTLMDVQAPASGWITRMINKGMDGLWAAVEWTEKAKKYIADKEYLYFSPVFWVRSKDRKVVVVKNIALTNDPKVNHLRPIIAKLAWSNEYESTTINKGGRIMWEKVKKLLGLADDAGENTVVEAVKSVIAKNTELETAAAKKPVEVVACKEVLDILKLDDAADKTMVIAAIGSLGKTDDVARELSLQVAKLTKEISGIKQNDLVALALKEGKTSPDELDKWGRDLALKNPTQFELIVLSRPAGSVIPMENIRHKDDLPDGVVADEAVMTVAKMMGVTAEDIKKYGDLQERG